MFPSATNVSRSKRLASEESVLLPDPSPGGMTKTKLAAELETTTDALRAWMTGRTVGRKERVAKLKMFL
ncbi:MAG TPA: hypothetical protein VN939_06140 [Chthoniobacterales bacterium]|nr:hypothetical protein [Chthoniobacterales bacterium]